MYILCMDNIANTFEEVFAYAHAVASYITSSLLHWLVLITNGLQLCINALHNFICMYVV